MVTGDSGAGATLGPFKSRVASIGPQIGFIFPVGGMQGYQLQEQQQQKCLRRGVFIRIIPLYSTKVR